MSLLSRVRGNRRQEANVLLHDKLLVAAQVLLAAEAVNIALQQQRANLRRSLILTARSLLRRRHRPSPPPRGPARRQS